MFGSFIKTMRAHKIISVIVGVVIVGGGYYWYSSANVAPSVTKYVVQDAATGTIVSSVSGTGQVQAGTTINVTPKVSETVTSIRVTVGQHVSAGQTLIQLDPTNEQRALHAGAAGARAGPAFRAGGRPGRDDHASAATGCRDDRRAVGD